MPVFFGGRLPSVSRLFAKQFSAGRTTRTSQVIPKGFFGGGLFVTGVTLPEIAAEGGPKDALFSLSPLG